MQPKYHSIDPVVKQLQSKNELLKGILTNQALELEFETEFLKKTNEGTGCKIRYTLFDIKINFSRMLHWRGINRSNFYYRRKSGKRGRKPSTHTPLNDGTEVSNISVIFAVKFILNIEFIDYGYRVMSSCLRQEGLLINRKKDYRLMAEQGLLYCSKTHSKADKRKILQ